MSGHYTPITHNGETLILREWAQKTGIPRETITCRINRGWPIGRALTEPSSAYLRRENKITKNDFEMKLNESPLSDLSDKFKKIVLVDGYAGTKFGQYLRNHHRSEFDQAFKDFHESKDGR